MKRVNNRRIYLALLIIPIAGSIFFATQIYNWGLDSSKAKEELSQAQQQSKQVVVSEKQDSQEKAPTYPFVKVDFTELIKRNRDVKAWLKIDAIGVDIPIVQATNNEFYLTHDLDKQQNTSGWVFADCRSNMESFGTNTVIYGHNMANGSMLGSQKKLLNPEVQNNPDAGIIQFTTPYQQMVFQVCSVYVTDYEDWEYVKTGFFNNAEKTAFIKRLQEKNEVPAFQRDDLNIMDKFLTLSTCYGPAGTPKRLVVVARQIAIK